jgi:nucleotide-binding universal stress UspA family protein
MKTIVAGYDGSEEAEHALVRAAEIAGPLGARLVVVHVGQDPRTSAPELVPQPVDPVFPGVLEAFPGAPATLPVPPEDDEPARRTLERARAVLAPRGVDAEYVSAVGDPVEVLLGTADERDADLVVVGSREHGFLERLLGLGVGERLARESDRDVLLVRGDGRDDQ